MSIKSREGWLLESNRLCLRNACEFPEDRRFRRGAHPERVLEGSRSLSANSKEGTNHRAFAVFFTQSPSFLAHQKATREQRGCNNAHSLSTAKSRFPPRPSTAGSNDSNLDCGSPGP